MRRLLGHGACAVWWMIGTVGCSSAIETTDDEPEAPSAAPPAGSPGATSATTPAASPGTGAALTPKDFVVYLQRADFVAKTHSACTGTLVAPNLVVTARHCVAILAADAARCGPDSVGKVNSGTFAGDVAPEKIVVSRTANRPSSASGGAVDGEPILCSAFAARGAALVNNGAASVCGGSDIAWLVLDRDIPLARYPEMAPAPPSDGAPLTAYGWGKVAADGAVTTTLKEIPLTVVQTASGVAPPGGCTNDEGEPSGSVLDVGEFGTSPGQFKGDSGGPAFDQAGRVAGVFSRFRTASEQGGNCTPLAVSKFPGSAPTEMARAIDAAKARRGQKGTPPVPDEDCVAD